MRNSYWLRTAAGAVLSLLVATGTDVAHAKERQTMKNGVAACKQWCDQNNKTVPNLSACYIACEKYWLCNGSDSTAATCQEGKNLAADRGAGTQPNPGGKPQPPAATTPTNKPTQNLAR